MKVSTILGMYLLLTYNSVYAATGREVLHINNNEKNILLNTNIVNLSDIKNILEQLDVTELSKLTSTSDKICRVLGSEVLNIGFNDIDLFKILNSESVRQISMSDKIEQSSENNYLASKNISFLGMNDVVSYKISTSPIRIRKDSNEKIKVVVLSLTEFNMMYESGEIILRFREIEEGKTEVIGIMSQSLTNSAVSKLKFIPFSMKLLKSKMEDSFKQSIKQFNKIIAR